MWIRRASVPYLALVATVFWVGGCAGASRSGDLIGAGDAWRASLEEAATRAVEPLPAADALRAVISGGRVMTAEGDDFPEGYVIIDDGRIQAVGAGAAPDVPGAVHFDARGMVVTPGLIDTHTHLGVYPSPRAKAHGDGNEMTNPTTPGVWSEHSLWPQDPGWQRAVEGGVVAAHVLPGSANLVGGRSVTVRPIPTRGSRAMRVPGSPFGVKMACGENPKRVYGKKGGPQTRMGNMKGFRALFARAQAWLKKADAGGADAGRDMDMESLALVLKGEALPQIHCYRADDMLAVIQLADEFGFSVRSFHHAVEAYKIRDILAEREIAVSTWADWWGFKLEAWDAVPENAAMIHSAGGRAVVHSDSARGIQRLNQEAAKALAAGRAMGLVISDDEALTWITSNPAWVLGIEDHMGSLAVGKRADIVVWDGDPFSVYTKAHWVLIDGVLRHDSAHPGPRWSDYEVGAEVDR